MNDKIKELLKDNLTDLEIKEVIIIANINEKFKNELLADDMHFEKNAEDMFDWLHDTEYAIYEYARNKIIKQEDVGKTLVEIEIDTNDGITELSTGTCIYMYE